MAVLFGANLSFITPMAYKTNLLVMNAGGYMFNDFVINPAIAGTQNYYQIRTNHRFQWVGMADPPMTPLVGVSCYT